MSINPHGMTLQSWFDAVLLDTRSSWSFGKLLSDDSWQDFAAGFVRAPPFAQRALPDPYQFGNWREWAQRVYPMLEGQG